MTSSCTPDTTEDTIYSNSSPWQGIALLICNKNFDKTTKVKKRKGAYADLLKLQLAFAQLGFAVRSYLDLKVSEILSTARKVAKDKLNQYNCLAVAVSTHGASKQVASATDYGMEGMVFLDEIDLLYGTDGAFPAGDLTSIFTEENCPSLSGKPKLFFFQGCRGEELAETVRVRLPVGEGARGGTPADSSASAAENPSDVDMSDTTDAPVNERTGPSTQLMIGVESFQQMEVDTLGGLWSGERGQEPLSLPPPQPAPSTSHADQPPPLDTQPEEEPPVETVVSRKIIISRDFLTMWSCPPGYFAFHRNDGSPFIQYLCDVLTANYQTEDLLTMLTEVNRKVATEYECRSRKEQLKGRHIVPSIEHMLRKTVLIRPQTS